MSTMPEVSAKRLFSIPIKTVYLLTDLCCMADHIVFLIFFTIIGVKEMVIFNIVSISLYVTFAFLLHTKINPSILISIGLVEIISHATLATICMGWSFGFSIFLVCIVPVPFLINFKYDVFSYIISFFLVVLFVALKLYSSDISHIIYYNIASEDVAIKIYIINSIVALALIIEISIVSKISKFINQQKLKQQNEKLTTLATIDPLTQLFNRRAMTNFFKMIHEIAVLSNGKYIIVLGDIDDFKLVNDSYGHTCGDEVLRRISKILTDTVPAEGYVCRWGGEELLFAIPNADCTAGTKVAEDIRRKIGTTIFNSFENEPFTVTITFGVCECSKDISYEEGLKIADTYLYRGKEAGKNCVVNCEPQPEPNENYSS